LNCCLLDLIEHVVLLVESSEYVEENVRGCPVDRRSDSQKSYAHGIQTISQHGALDILVGGLLHGEEQREIGAGRISRGCRKNGSVDPVVQHVVRGFDRAIRTIPVPSAGPHLPQSPEANRIDVDEGVARPVARRSHEFAAIENENSGLSVSLATSPTRL